jgi:hypothetical protein
MPCFEGLFPQQFDGAIQNVLFSMAAFHGFAKMRMHTDTSLAIFDGLTTQLGKVIRFFANRVCPELPTRATAKEAAAKARQRARAANKKSTTRTNKTKSKSDKDDCRKFNIFTYKWHALTHYVHIIRRYGTLDFLGTQRVCQMIILSFLMSL